MTLEGNSSFNQPNNSACKWSNWKLANLASKNTCQQVQTRADIPSIATLTLASAYATPEKFENGGVSLKKHQMLSVHTTLEEFVLDLCLKITQIVKSHDYSDIIALILLWGLAIIITKLLTLENWHQRKSYAQINKENPKTLNLAFWRNTTAIPLSLIIKYHKDTIKAYLGFEYVVQTQMR